MMNHSRREGNLEFGTHRLRGLALALILGSLILGCSPKDAGDGSTNADPAAEGKRLAADTAYVSHVTRWVGENLLQAMNETEAAAYVDSHLMHYTMVAFNQLYPNNPKVPAWKERVGRYGVLQAPDSAALYVPIAELSSKYNFDGVENVYYWGDGFGFMEVDSEGNQIWQGPICLGNLQLIQGAFCAASTEAGPALKLLPGTRMLYPLDK
jgi:hypothetical protein